jgi:hypothetical protein
MKRVALVRALTSRATQLTGAGSLVLASTLTVFVGHGAAATLTNASLTLGDSRPSQTSNYTVTANGLTTGSTIGCIEVDLGTASDGTGAISGLSTSSSAFVSQTITASGTWTVDNSASAAGKLRFVNGTPVVPQSGSQTATWSGVVNGNTADSGYYGVVKTYTTNACSTPVDNVTVSFIYTNGTAVTANVDPSLSFAITGAASGATCNTVTSTVTTTAATVPFGTVTSAANSIGIQNMSVSTSAGHGYTVTTRYTGALTNGTANIANYGGSNASPTNPFPSAGTEGYGYTTNDAVLGTGTANRFTNNGPNWAGFSSTAGEIGFNSAAVSNDTFCVAQQLAIATNTPAGAYATTVVYTATPVY